jgi:hypothetical protein
MVTEDGKLVGLTEEGVPESSEFTLDDVRKELFEGGIDPKDYKST